VHEIVIASCSAPRACHAVALAVAGSVIAQQLGSASSPPSIDQGQQGLLIGNFLTIPGRDAAVRHDSHHLVIAAA